MINIWCFPLVHQSLNSFLKSPIVSPDLQESLLGFWEMGFLWREWCWNWNSSTLATSCEELTHWKRLRCWEGLRAGGEGDKRGWDGWMTSLTRWTWVWVNSRSWWWIGRPAIHGVAKSRTRLSDWSDLIWVPEHYFTSKARHKVDLCLYQVIDRSETFKAK